ncbi:MAG: AAA family ATPase [Chloroflexi bacterium]|nr:AAA family ATPase [Chloroflexota bacterium]MCI0580564.1 AAA family ATPase [Chloroflexota bacterium]MCI0647596.1 AAA family ATPase [Chloroflexota bacterium]MCI0730673.1 AAA family ATPase [Chloroflexota bacterium]
MTIHSRARTVHTPVSFTSFGDLLKFLRRRSHLTQRDLALAVGYTEAHVCRLEKNQRLPDETTVAALFVPALELEREPVWAEQLLQLATDARQKNLATTRPQRTSPAIPPQDGIPPAPAGFVARPALLERLRRHLATERRVALTGLPGMGKTTLAAASAHEAAKRGPVFWLTLTSGITTPVEAIIRHLAGFLLAQGLTKVRPLLSPAAEKGASLSFDQQVALLTAALNSRPALLCFDDVHLVSQDATTLALFRHLMAATPAALLFVSREEVPLAGVPHLRLAGLAEAEALDLLDQLGSRLAPELARRLLAKTGHSPMLLRLAVGQLLNDEATPNAGPATFIDHLEMHPQVASYLLDTILNCLQPDTRALVEWMSIFRRPVNLYDQNLADHFRQATDVQDVAIAIADLQRRHLVHHPAQADLHPLVRDHVRATLALRSQWQKRLHRAAAQWWETGQGNIVEAAYHHLQFNDVAQAVELLTDQGNWLFDQGQGPAALEVVDEALDRLPRQPTSKNNVLRRQLLIIRGDLLAYTTRTIEAEENYRQALALATQPSVRAHITARLAYVLNTRGQIEDVQRLCQAAIASLTPTDTLLLASLKVAEAWTHYQKSDFVRVNQLAHEVFDLTDQLPPNLLYVADELRTRTYSVLGAMNSAQGEYTPALDHLQRGVEAARRSGLKSREYIGLAQIAGVHFTQGDLELALPTYETAINGLLATGNILAALRYQSFLAYLSFMRLETPKALEHLRETSDLHWQLGDLQEWANNMSMQVQVLLSLGRVAEARRAIESVLEATRELNQLWKQANYLDRLAMVQMLEGNFAGAQNTLSAAIALPGMQNISGSWVELQYDLAIALLAQEEIEAAQALVTELLPPDQQIWMQMERHLTRAAVALASGDKAGVAEAAGAVLERCQATGHKLYELRARRLLAASRNPPPAAALPWLLWVDVSTEKWGPEAQNLPHLAIIA